MTLPPLPLIDGKLLIDNSSLENFMACPRRMQYLYLNRRVNAAERSALNFGAGVHEGLKTRYKLCSSNPVDDATSACINAALAKHFDEHPQPEDEYRTLEYATTTLQVYNDTYRREPFSILDGPKGPMIEASFAHELGSVHSIPVIYTGRVDLSFKDDNGEWVMDHKTTFEFGKSFESTMATSAQFIGYCWAFQQTFGRKPAGYYINAIRTRPPTKEEQRAKAFGLEVKGRADNLQRFYYHVSDDNIDEWKRDTLAAIATFVSHHDLGFFPRYKTGCVGKYGRCQYYDICTIPQEKRDWALSTTMFQDNDWTPLTKPTTKEIT